MLYYSLYNGGNKNHTFYISALTITRMDDGEINMPPVEQLWHFNLWTQILCDDYGW